MNKTVIDKCECTACGLCIDICSRNCITFQKDDTAAVYPIIDESKCISCHICENVCPSINITENDYSFPRKLFVAWNQDNDIRKTSASGGIASGFYQYSFEMGGYVTGVTFNNDQELVMSLYDRSTFDQACQNSKYAYCKTVEVFPKTIEVLKTGTPVFFIGLPCQVAAMKMYANLNRCSKYLTTCDIICHGVAPIDYLHEHIEHVIGNRKLIDKIFFRDPKYGTENFVFSLYRNGKVVYKKRVKSEDAYQNGYHSALIYRENCYSCRYARPERVGDLTIGDFSGLGSKTSYTGERINVSSVMINTDKGESFWKKANKYFHYEERPLSEALEVEKQLIKPSIKTAKHDLFVELYRANKGFDRSVVSVISGQIIRGFLYELTCLDFIKNCIRRIKKWNFDNLL